MRTPHWCEGHEADVSCGETAAPVDPTTGEPDDAGRAYPVLESVLGAEAVRDVTRLVDDRVEARVQAIEARLKSIEGRTRL